MSENYNEYFHIWDVKTILGVDFNAPNHTKMCYNILNINPRQKTDKKYLLLQHLTTGYKLGASSYYYSQLKSYSAYYTVTPLQDGKLDIEVDPRSQGYFQLSIDNFFTMTWGAVISVCRELWKVYNLKLNSNEVNFYFIKQQFNKEFKNTDIAKYLDKINKEIWFIYLNGARNRMEHGQVIMIEIKSKTGDMVIADDQNVDGESLTTMMHYEPVPWCNTIFDETCKFVDYCCRDMNVLQYE